MDDEGALGMGSEEREMRIRKRLRRGKMTTDISYSISEWGKRC